MKKTRMLHRILAVILIAGILASLTGCGKKSDTEDEPDVSNIGQNDENPDESEYNPEDLTPVGGFDDDETPAPTETQEPEETKPPEETDSHPGTYGGIPMRNILTFFIWFSEQDGVTISGDHTQEEADALIAEMKNLEDKSDAEVTSWFDKNLIGSEDYRGYTQDEIDEARNMTIVLMAAMIQYVPDVVSLEDFLGQEGLEIMARWQEKLQNQSGETEPGGQTEQNPEQTGNPDNNGDNTMTPGGTGTGQTPSGDTGTGITGDSDNTNKYGTKDSASYSAASARNYDGGIELNFTVSVPELAGTGRYPYIVVLIYNPDGTVKTYQTCAYSKTREGTNTDLGIFVYRCTFSASYAYENVQGYIYVRYIPSWEYVESFEAIPMSECVRIA